MGLCCLGCLGVFYGAYHIGEITLILGTFLYQLPLTISFYFVAIARGGGGGADVCTPLINHKWL